MAQEVASMPWKKDEDGHLMADGNGNPLWVQESGEEKPVDYSALCKRLSEVNAESKGRKEELRKLNEKYAVLADIEDLPAWHKEALEALEFKKNAPEKDKEVEAQVNGRVEAATSSLKSQLADSDKKLGERDKSISELTSKLHNMTIRADVHSSKLLNERIRPEDRPFIEREMIRAGAVDDEGKVFYRYDDGETIYGEDGNAKIDEAVLLFLKKLGIDPATKLMSQDDSSGSNGKSSPGAGIGGGKNPWKKENWNVTEQSRITLKDPAEAERMRKAAGC